MSGRLLHSPVWVVRQLLVDLLLGTLPTTNGAWPIAVQDEPDVPDEVITLYDTTGNKDGRSMIDGEIWEHPGFQVRVRSTRPELAFDKINAIATAMDEAVNRASVTIGSSVYRVDAISRQGNPISLGTEEPTSMRNVFTVNALVALTQIA